MAKWQRVTIDIPKRFGPTERQSIAQDVIQFIIERTRDGKDKNGNDFRGRYSDAYRGSLDYKNAGKPKSGRPIDLTLTGEMLDLLGLVSERPGQITIGYERGADVNGKVEGNILGSYGGAPNKSRARDFLGITKDDLKKILEQYSDDSKSTAQERLAAAERAGDIANGIELE